MRSWLLERCRAFLGKSIFFHSASFTQMYKWEPVSIILHPVQGRRKELKPWGHDWLIAAGAYPSFCSMKRLGVFLLPPGLDVKSISGPSPQFVRFPPTICRYPFILLGGETHFESLVSYPRTHYSVPGQGSIPDRSTWGLVH